MQLDLLTTAKSGSSQLDGTTNNVTTNNEARTNFWIRADSKIGPGHFDSHSRLQFFLLLALNIIFESDLKKIGLLAVYSKRKALTARSPGPSEWHWQPFTVNFKGCQGLHPFFF